MDIADEGIVTITAPDQVSGEKAVEWVKKLTYVPKVGDVFDGKVVKIMEFGAFVEMTPGKDGLVHISELDNKRVNKVEDVVKLGDIIKVKLMKVDDQGRFNLSRKALMGADAGAMNGQASSAFAKQEQGKTDEGKGGTGPIVEGTRHVRKVNGDER